MGVFGTIQSAIATDLRTIANIGVVIASAPLPPLVEDWAAFIDAFTVEIGGARVVRAWTLTFAGSRALQVRRGAGSQKELREVRYVIRGYLGHCYPDSGATFRDLIEEIASTLDTDLGLRGTVIEHEPVEIDVPDNGDAVLLGDVVCHYCEITLAARVEVTLPAA